MTYALELDNLAVDADGYLYCKMESVPDVELGVLERIPDVPAGLVQELTELLDLWRDARGRYRDERDDWRANYRRQSGV